MDIFSYKYVDDNVDYYEARPMKTVQILPRLSNVMTVSLLCAALMSLLVSQTTQAEQSREFGKYTVHYSAFTTDNLTTAIAKQYNIPRSKKRALLNISVHLYAIIICIDMLLHYFLFIILVYLVFLCLIIITVYDQSLVR